RSLSQLVGERQARFPVSGEINLELPDPGAALAGLKAALAAPALSVDETDGVSLEFERWRVNVRSSNTEPVVRVNLETRGDRSLLDGKRAEVLAVLRGREWGFVRRIVLAQINTTVGDLEGNARRIIECIEEAQRGSADMVVFPELAISGYPPEDLLLKG